MTNSLFISTCRTMKADAEMPHGLLHGSDGLRGEDETYSVTHHVPSVYRGTLSTVWPADNNAGVELYPARKELQYEWRVTEGRRGLCKRRTQPGRVSWTDLLIFAPRWRRPEAKCYKTRLDATHLLPRQPRVSMSGILLFSSCFAPLEQFPCSCLGPKLSFRCTSRCLPCRIAFTR